MDGKPVYVWVDIALKDKRSNLVETADITPTMNSPNYNLSGKQINSEQLERAGEESTWLDENREVKK